MGEHWATELTRHNDPRTLRKVRGFSGIVAGFSKIRETVLAGMSGKFDLLNRKHTPENGLRGVSNSFTNSLKSSQGSLTPIRLGSL